MLSILETGLNIISKIIPDKEKQNEAKLKLFELEQDGVLKEMESKSSVIKAEANSQSWLARNWRPILMLVFILILFNNYVLCSIFSTFGIKYVVMQIPPNMWTLLEIGVGGYIGGRSAEKIADKWINK